MGINLNSLANKVRGSIGNITFYPMMDKTIVRSKAHHIKNPKSKAQLENRLNMLPLLKAYRQLKPLLYLSLNNRPSNRKAYHHFLSLNLGNSFVNGIFSPELFKVSGTCFDSDIFDITRINEPPYNIQLNWIPSIIGQKNNSDLLCLAIYNPFTNLFGFKLTNTNRSSGYALLNIGLFDDLNFNWLYIFFVKSNYSDSGLSYNVQLSDT